jgi:hypothetical protein
MAVTLGRILAGSLRKAWPMTCIAVRGPPCQREHSGTRSTTARGPQRSRGQPPRWVRGRGAARLWPPGGLACSQTHDPRQAAPGQRGAGDGAIPAALSHPRAAGTHEARRGAGGGAPCAALHAAPRGGARGPEARWGSGGGGDGGVWREPRPPAGAGRPSSPTPARAGPPSVVAAQMRALCRAQRCGSRAGAPVTPPLSGGPTLGSAHLWVRQPQPAWEHTLVQTQLILVG